MWVVRASGDLYVRSAGGPAVRGTATPWPAGRGRIRAGGIDSDVRFAEAAPDAQAAIDAAYHAKYGRYGPIIVGHVTGPEAHAVTIRLLPATEEGNQP